MHLKFENRPLKPIDWESEIQRVREHAWCPIPECESAAKLGAMAALCEQFGRELNRLVMKYNAVRED